MEGGERHEPGGPSDSLSNIPEGATSELPRLGMVLAVSER